MIELASQATQLSTGQLAKPKGSAKDVYWRLVKYAWRYKMRLIVSLVFAILIAASFGTLLVSMGTVIDLTFYNPQGSMFGQQASSQSAAAKPSLLEAGKPVKRDPAEKALERIRLVNDEMERIIGWAPRGLESWFMDLVHTMRTNPMHALTVLCIVIVFLALFINVTRYWQEYFAGTIGASISTDLGEEMYVNLMRQPVAFFESQGSGEILARFANDVFMVNRGLSGVFVKLMREPFKALTFLAVAISVDFWLTLVGVCVLPPVAYALIHIGKKMRRSVRRSLQKIASMTSVINESVVGISIVKGYNMEKYETQRVLKEIYKLRKFLFHMVKWDAATGPVTEFMMIIGIALFVLLSGRRVISGALKPGDLVQLFVALGMMLDPVRKLSQVNNMIQTSVASAERVFEFLDVEPSIVEPPDAIEAPAFAQSLRFENVTFSYDGERNVLSNVDLEVRKGEMVALVGFSGAGKSTVVKLIPRFYDVNEGSITLDGTDIRQLTFRSLRDQISIVTQNTILFAESIRDNIGYGHTDFTDERVRGAAEAAHATEFIELLPEGFDTVIGESGCTLSGGQRQRLAIARAIIKDPAILILDEATSSLDSESERLIQQALDEFVTGRTAIVIAHRLSTIRRANRVVVLDGGRIVEQGTHEELMERGGIFKRLYETEFGLQETPA
jgi:subfamily B ATP-binding cassette protein MsbA